MLKKIKLMILSLSSLVILAVPMAAGGVAMAVTQSDINGTTACGTNIDFTNTNPNGCSVSNTNAGSGDSATTLAKNVINILSLVVGAVAVIMLIIGGFRYVTSGGKQESVTSAKNTIIYALIGIVIVAIAQVVVQFVLTKTTSAL